MRLEFFYLYSDGDENQEPTVYPSFAFGKKTVLWTVLREAREKRVPEDGPSVSVYKSFLIDHHFCIFRGISAHF